MREFFQEFWSKQSDPLHRSADPEYLDAYGRELQVLLGERDFVNVLELGCGTGTFFSRLGFDQATQYVGVDFSQSMLEVFERGLLGRPKPKQFSLVCKDASTFHTKQKFDLIFSNAMVQNFNKEMLDEHLRHSSDMLSQNGILIIGSVPWRSVLYSYLSGEAGPNPYSAHAIKAMLGVLQRSTWMNGKWWSCKQISTLARKNGFESDFFGSMYYPYRMHVKLRLKT